MIIALTLIRCTYADTGILACARVDKFGPIRAQISVINAETGELFQKTTDAHGCVWIKISASGRYVVSLEDLPSDETEHLDLEGPNSDAPSIRVRINNGKSRKIYFIYKKVGYIKRQRRLGPIAPIQGASLDVRQ